MDNGILFGILLIVCLVSVSSAGPVKDDEFNQSAKDCKSLCGECNCMGFYCGEECLCECEKQTEEETKCIATMVETCEKKNYPFEVLIQGPDSNRLTRRSMMYQPAPPTPINKSPEDVCVKSGPMVAAKSHRTTVSIYKPKVNNDGTVTLDVKSFLNEIGTQLAEKLQAETIKLHQQQQQREEDSSFKYPQITEGIKIREITPKKEYAMTDDLKAPSPSVAKIREITKGVNNEIISEKRPMESIKISKPYTTADDAKKDLKTNDEAEPAVKITSVLFPFEMKTAISSNLKNKRHTMHKNDNLVALSHVPTATKVFASDKKVMKREIPKSAIDQLVKSPIESEIKSNLADSAPQKRDTERQLTAIDALALISLTNQYMNKRKREVSINSEDTAAIPADTVAAIDTLSPVSSIDAVAAAPAVVQAKRDADEVAAAADDSVASAVDESVAMPDSENVAAMFTPKDDDKFDLGSSLKKLLFFDGIDKLGFTADKKLVELLKAEVLMDVLKGALDFDKLGLSLKKFDLGDLVKFAKFDGFGLDKLGIPGLDLAKFGLEKLKLEALGLEKLGLTKLAKLDLLGKKIDLGSFLIGKKLVTF